MLPVSGSTYTYAYATLGELVAWIIGWDLMLEYLLASSAVSVGWSGYFQSLIAGFGLYLPDALTAAAGARPGVTTCSTCLRSSSPCWSPRCWRSVSRNRSALTISWC